MICTSCYWLLVVTVINLLKYYICNSYKTTCFRKKMVIQIVASKRTSCAGKSEAPVAKKTRTETAPGTSKIAPTVVPSTESGKETPQAADTVIPNTMTPPPSPMPPATEIVLQDFYEQEDCVYQGVSNKVQELVKQNKYSNCGAGASLEVCIHCKVLFYIRVKLP